MECRQGGKGQNDETTKAQGQNAECMPKINVTFDKYKESLTL